MLKPSKLILADEPTGNLDQTNSSKVWDILKQEIILEKIFQ